MTENHPVPGKPGTHTPDLKQTSEPAKPVATPEPASHQAGPSHLSPTGCPFHLGADANSGSTAAETERPNAQQGEYLTTAQGGRVVNTDHSLKAGKRGPVLMQDHHLREKITHFDHERIPERAVHARGAGAHGVFKSNGKAASLIKAAMFKKGAETEVFTRFSTVLGSRGSADTVRDTRGFAVKFYSDEGTWDLVGNNMPVFFIQDAIKFPDLIHAGKPHPDREIPQAQSAHDTFWDFVSLHTEATHLVLWNMSDRGIPRSLRMMEGFGVHTFRVENAKGETALVKFHWKPRLGVHSLVWEEAQLANGFDPDMHRRDLADSIENGAYPEWDLGVQVFPDTPEETFEGIDLLDPTKLVPEELAPVQIIGTMTLNANPTNYFAETEQVAFHPGHLVPGIDVTADPLLQGRMFSYLDTQLSRLGGPNFSQLPINRPHAPVNDGFRDGLNQQAIHTGVAAYTPNSLDAGNPSYEETDSTLSEIAVPVEGEITRAKPVSFDDHFTQARLFYISLSEIEQQHLTDAISFELGKVFEESIKQRAVNVLANVDTDLAAAVAKSNGLKTPAKVELPDVEPSAALSQVGKTWPIDGRQVGILVTEDSDKKVIKKLVKKLADAGTVPLVTSTVGGGEFTSRTYFTVRSIEFDAAIVVDTPKDEPRVHVLKAEMDAHGKAVVAYSEEGAKKSTAKAVDEAVEQAVDEVVEALAAHRSWAK